MRVAYVCADPDVPVFGRKGASIHVQEVIRALVRRGVHVELFAVRLGGKTPPDFHSVSIHSLPPIPRADHTTWRRAALAVNEVVRIALERRGPFDFVYERYSPGSYAGMEYAQTAGIPGLLEVNAPLIGEHAEHRGFVCCADAERAADRAFRAATALLAVSEEVAACLESHPAARGRVHVVPNGADPDRFRPGLTPALPGGPGKFTVGFAGTLRPWHGLEILADAFAILRHNAPGVRLLIVGDGPGRRELAARLAAHRLQGAVHFAGMVDPQEMPAWVASMDVAVAPYPRREGYYFSPLKVFEYMAAGVPVVASRVGQLAQLIEDGVNGILVPPGDAVALANALNQLRIDPDLRARLGPAGRMTVLRKHTWDAVAKRILSLAEAEARPVVLLERAIS